MNANTVEEAKALLYGNIMEVELPSGHWAKIREQNGEDDDIISNPVLAKDLSNVSILLSSLIIETNLPMAKNGKISLKDTDKILVNDQAVLLLASRINSLGSTLNFSFDWGEGQVFNYTEELEQYIWPYITKADEFPYQPNQPHYFEFRCNPYTSDAYEKKVFTLNSGKVIRLKHMDIASQKKLINLPAEKNTKNSEFLIRDLEIQLDGNWQNVENFKFFNSREMSEMRSILQKLDAPFKGITVITNPTSGEEIKYPFMGNQSFFFPGETEI